MKPSVVTGVYLVLDGPGGGVAGMLTVRCAWVRILDRWRRAHSYRVTLIGGVVEANIVMPDGTRIEPVMTNWPAWMCLPRPGQWRYLVLPTAPEEDHT